VGPAVRIRASPARGPGWQRTQTRARRQTRPPAPRRARWRALGTICGKAGLPCGPRTRTARSPCGRNGPNAPGPGPSAPAPAGPCPPSCTVFPRPGSAM